jgi:hypothetical protein
VGSERAQECARRHESKRCKMECVRQMVRDGTRRGRQPAGGSRRCDTLRAARARYFSRKKEKEGTERRTVPVSMKESRDSRGRVVEPWLCRLC